MGKLRAEAPSKINQDIFNTGHNVFYGTDDGFQDGSFGEFEELEAFYEGLPATRRQNIHLVSTVGGLYGLNLIPFLRPTEITFFDINPHAVTYFNLIRRVLVGSQDKIDFLERLTNRDYEVTTDAEKLIRENIALKQRDELPRERGSSKRSFEASWRYALDRFELTRTLLAEAQVAVRTEGMESPAFKAFMRDQSDCWLYSSNIFEFVYFDLHFTRPENVVALSIIYPGQVDLLDLDPLSKYPLELKCEIPMQVRRMREFKLIVGADGGA